MDAEEINKLVDEVEERVERLRVLYDQYFMGIEKIPPDVLKKDVERRMWVLRREKIRNTGVRFKFQSITQRLNTFQSYWMRICREIENGTYKRDLVRAKRRFGTETTTTAAREAPPQPIEYAVVSVPVDLDNLDDLPVAEEVEEVFELDEDGMDLRETTKTPIQPAELPIVTAQVRPNARPIPAETQTRALIVPTAPVNPRPAPLAAKPVAPATPKPNPADAARASTITARAVCDEDDLDAMLDAALGDSNEGKPPQPKEQRAPATKEKTIVAAVAAPKVQAAAESVPKIAMVNATRPSAGGPRPPPGERRPATAAVEKKPVAALPTARASSPEKGDDRQVYARFVEAKRKNGESTAGLTFEQLQKNLEATRAKLKDKSGGRAIAFDVVVKDGKTILKPVVK